MEVEIAVRVAWPVMELLTIVTKILREWVSTVEMVLVRGRAIMGEKEPEGWSAGGFKGTLQKARTLKFQ